MQRIHIVGCGPRTGTTLIAEMMNACFEIDLYTEHEDSIYAQPTRDANIFLTKRPRDILVAGPMLRVMPNLYVIYMLRDPRDMITSKHGKDPERYWASLRYWKTYTPYGRKLQKHPRFITVRYEELVTQPDEVQAYLMQRMWFLKKRARFSRYHELAQPSKEYLDALHGVRPVTPASVGNWRKHLSRVAGQIQKHGAIAQDLIEYGYEPDDSWLKELKDVTLDTSESHWPEYFTKKDLNQRMQGKYLMATFALMRLFNVNSLPAIAKLLRENLPFPILHLYRIYTCNLSTVVERQPLNLLQNQLTTTKKLITNTKTILFYPELPSLSFAIYHICLFLGYKVTNNPAETFDICIKWKDATFSPKDGVLSRLSAQNINVVNINCEDISKSYVDKVFHSVFGYSIAIAPLTYNGKCVMKSDLNGQHDGKIISCPIDTIEPGVVYNKLIDNEVEDGTVLHYRVPIFKHVIPLVYLKRLPLEHRFGTSSAHLVSSGLAEVDDVFSKEEIGKILCFCQKMGLDYGELDVLRDRNNQQLYIVDVNNTPSATMISNPLKRSLDKPERFLSANDRLIALQKLAHTFQEVLLS